MCVFFLYYNTFIILLILRGYLLIDVRIAAYHKALYSSCSIDHIGRKFDYLTSYNDST